MADFTFLRKKMYFIVSTTVKHLVKKNYSCNFKVLKKN